MEYRSETVTNDDGTQVELATVIHEGREFTNMGAMVSPTFLAGYLAKDGKLTDWQGNAIGTWRLLSSWPTPRSYVSSRYYSVECRVNGVRYVGRSAGVGMLVKAKRSPKQ